MPVRIIYTHTHPCPPQLSSRYDIFYLSTVLEAVGDINELYIEICKHLKQILPRVKAADLFWEGR